MSPGARSALTKESSDTTSAANTQLPKNKYSAQGIYTMEGSVPAPKDSKAQMPSRGEEGVVAVSVCSAENMRLETQSPL